MNISQAAGPESAGHDLVNGCHNFTIAAGAQNAVHLRKLSQHISLIALGHAAGDEKLFELSGLFQLRHFQNIVDGLFTGGGQEAAGIHHRHIRPLRVSLDGMSGSLDRGHHLLAVHLVFGTAQGNKCNII